MAGTVAAGWWRCAIRRVPHARVCAAVTRESGGQAAGWVGGTASQKQSNATRSVIACGVEVAKSVKRRQSSTRGNCCYPSSYQQAAAAVCFLLRLLLLRLLLPCDGNWGRQNTHNDIEQRRRPDRPALLLLMRVSRHAGISAGGVYPRFPPANKP